nr:MAG TPA: hypothetical protein [Caudoviricetes sp.]
MASLVLLRVSDRAYPPNFSFKILQILIFL